MVVQLYRTKRRGPFLQCRTDTGTVCCLCDAPSPDQVPQPNDRQAGSVVQISLKHIADLASEKMEPMGTYGKQTRRKKQSAQHLAVQ